MIMINHRLFSTLQGHVQLTLYTKQHWMRRFEKGHDVRQRVAQAQYVSVMISKRSVVIIRLDLCCMRNNSVA